MAEVASRRFRLRDFTPLQQRVLLALKGTTRTKSFNIWELGDLVYANQKDGGPIDIDCALEKTIIRIRKKLKGTPVQLKANIGSGGYWLGGPATGEQHENISSGQSSRETLQREAA